MPRKPEPVAEPQEDSGAQKIWKVAQMELDTWKSEVSRVINLANLLKPYVEETALRVNVEGWRDTSATQPWAADCPAPQATGPNSRAHGPRA